MPLFNIVSYAVATDSDIKIEVRIASESDTDSYDVEDDDTLKSDYKEELEEEIDDIFFEKATISNIPEEDESRLFGVSSDTLCFTANEAGSKVKYETLGSIITPNMQYSYNDLSSWTNWVMGSTGEITLTNVGDKIYVKGDNLAGLSYDIDNYLYFIMSGKISASGDVMSLIDDGACTTTSIPNDYCFYKLFESCHSLLTAPKLSATTLTRSCYAWMFFNCTSLASAPKLLAETMKPYCYDNMFRTCRKLANSPDLPSTHLAEGCYQYMFAECSMLTGSSLLPAIYATPSLCYAGMYGNCTSLKNPQEIKATSVGQQSFYCMFDGCSSLKSVPNLPATNIDTECYYRMFAACSSLVRVPQKLLPATELKSCCYQQMFSECSLLENVPDIPATTLADNCFNSMFYNCTSIVLKNTSSSDINVQWKVSATSAAKVTHI